VNEGFQLNLALILFLPWYAILGGLYCFYPRKPRSRGRLLFDVGALVLTLLASVAAMHWGFLTADTSVGVLWKQVLATSVSYGAFMAALTAAFFLRRHLILKNAL
jgi:hypothetical protein